jgi:predicted dehydrogenase
MDKVRIGIVGYGVIGGLHQRYLSGGEVPRAELAAIADIDPSRLELARANAGERVRLFDSAEKLFASGQVDAVIIATPHYFHPPLAIEAFKAGLHVMSEKPAGVYTKQVRQMNEAAAASGRVFGVMFNQRTNPLYQKLKDLVAGGELGPLKRTNWIITTWYRSQSYYDSGGWRATWAGEGGGVLLNQDPHQLDLWQWICGMPRRVRAFCYFGKDHDIEVEDDVTAFVEYENGATGVFVTSTSDTPGSNRLEVTGGNGKIVVENDALTFWRLRVPERQFNAEYKGGFGQPECWKCEIPIRGTAENHQGIARNFAAAILDGTPLLAPGQEGIRGLELSNAMHLSSWTDDWVNLPIDEELFYEKLKERIETSSFTKKGAAAGMDVNKSF